MPRLLVIYLEQIFLPPFPHWVNAAGPNKEKEMWFNGVHKSGFHAAKSKQHMLFHPFLPSLPELVILLNFSVSRAVSCGSWGSWCHRLFLTTLPFWRGVHPSLHRFTLIVCFCPTFYTRCVKTDEKWGAGGERCFDCCSTSPHWEQHFIKHKWLTHGMCLEGRKQACYKVNCLEPTELPRINKHLAGL